MLKQNGEKFRKQINHSTIKVSWIQEPDYSHTINRYYKQMVNNQKSDFGCLWCK